MAQTTHRNPKNAFNEKGEKVRGESYWAKIPLTMVSAGLTGAAWDVYVTLDGMQGKKAFCWPSIDYLAKKTNQSPTTVKRAISTLEKSMFLFVERKRGRVSRYYVINGARRSGEEMEPCGQPALKKPRKNNLHSPGGSKRNFPASSKVTKSEANFEPVIRSGNKSSLIKSIEKDKSAKPPLRLIQINRVTEFIDNFGAVSE